nr:MAG TPA: hypothetical protein [Caudoviricetes sp.]
MRSVSPDGDKGSALDLQGGRVPLDSRLGIAVSGTLHSKMLMDKETRGREIRWKKPK